MTDIDAYRALIASKAVTFEPRGLSKIPPLNPAMFPHQEACTRFALEAGCAGLFLATGIGSEGWSALKTGRRFVGFELNPKYYEYAVRNLTDAEAQFGGGNDLFSAAAEVA